MYASTSTRSLLHQHQLTYTSYIRQVALRERLAERRKNKLAALRRKHESEISREMVTQKEEYDQIHNEKVLTHH